MANECVRPYRQQSTENAAVILIVSVVCNVVRCGGVAGEIVTETPPAGHNRYHTTTESKCTRKMLLLIIITYNIIII